MTKHTWPMTVGIVLALVLLVNAGPAFAETAVDPSTEPCPYFTLPDNDAADWSSCSSCHPEHSARFDESAHGLSSSGSVDLEVGGPELTGTCADCHVPRRPSDEQVRPDFTVVACDTCHKEQGSALQTDIHTEQGNLDCATCHDPHAVAGGDNEAREATDRCTKCHLDPVQKLEGSSHAAQGLTLAQCSDCHAPHSVRMPEDPRVLAASASESCMNCHEGVITESYDYSFHGKALALGDNSVATCVDCHGHHEVDGFEESGLAALPVGTRITQSCSQAGCHARTASSLMPADYQEHTVPMKSESFPIKFTWKFFIVLILFDTFKDGPIVILELVRTLVNDVRARAGRRKEGEVT